MGIAIDTVAGYVTAGATTAKSLAGVTVATGDSLTVKHSSQTGKTTLEAVLYDGTAKDAVRIISPLLHDDVNGITYLPDETPSQFLLPRVTGQPLTDGDTLTVEAGAAVSTTSVVALVNYYTDLLGGAQRLHMWGDIQGIVKNIKAIEVDTTAATAVGTWTDTEVDTTDKTLHAKSDYAVLGYITDTAVAAIGVKGQATNNLRVCGPGASSSLDISEYFVSMSDRHGTPHIVVFNGDDRQSFYVSYITDDTSKNPKVSLVLAELAHTITP